MATKQLQRSGTLRDEFETLYPAGRRAYGEQASQAARKRIAREFIDGNEPKKSVIRQHARETARRAAVDGVCGDEALNRRAMDYAKDVRLLGMPALERDELLLALAEVVQSAAERGYHTPDFDKVAKMAAKAATMLGELGDARALPLLRQASTRLGSHAPFQAEALCIDNVMAALKHSATRPEQAFCVAAPAHAQEKREVPITQVASDSFGVEAVLDAVQKMYPEGGGFDAREAGRARRIVKQFFGNASREDNPRVMEAIESAASRATSDALSADKARNAAARGYYLDVRFRGTEAERSAMLNLTARALEEKLAAEPMGQEDVTAALTCAGMMVLLGDGRGLPCLQRAHEELAGRLGRDNESVAKFGDLINDFAGSGNSLAPGAPK